MKSPFTALTRPRISSGVAIWTREERMTTLITSAAQHDHRQHRQPQPAGEGKDDGRKAEKDDGAEHGPADPGAQRTVGEEHRHGERADRWARTQQAQTPGPRLEDVPVIHVADAA